MAEQARVLIVDDNATNRLKLRQAVESLGYAADAVAGGEEALAALRAEPHDAVLLDIVMPGMDGHEVLSRLKADSRLRDIPVIVVSAVDELASVVRAIEQGAEDYLPKDFERVVLAARLRASLERQRVVSLERDLLAAQRLASIGRLAAGMAHELNNPAAAARRAGEQLRAAVSALQDTQFELAAGLTDLQLAALRTTRHALRAREEAGWDALQRSAAEDALEQQLADYGAEEPWDQAAALADAGCRPEDLAPLAAAFPGQRLAVAAAWLAQTLTIAGLLTEVGDATGRVAAIVDKVKRFVRLDEAPTQWVDVRTSLEDTIALIVSESAGGTTVEREYATTLPEVLASPVDLNEVWGHLMDNALRHAAEHVTVRAHAANGVVLVEVEDDGRGVSAEDVPHLFDPFFTTLPPGQGTGLGLTIAQAAVTRHGGTIAVDSKPGRTIFSVQLPVTSKGPQGARPG